MRDPLTINRGVLAAAFLTLAITPLVALRAQQPPAHPQGQQPAQPQGQPPAPPRSATPAPPPPQKVLKPVSAGTLAATPDKFYGSNVTITAPVDQILSPLAFSMDQDPTKSTGKDVLILAPRLNEPVTLNAYLTVLGDVVQFDPAEIAKATDLKLDLPSDVAEKYRGKPAIVAKTILTANYVELTRKLPSPMTADDGELSRLMKRIQPAFAAVRVEADKTDMAAVRQNAVILKQSFNEVESFWRSKGKPDAVKWAADARLQAEAIERVVATGKWDQVKAAAGTLGKSCQGCHAAYRERFDDGSFRIKMSSR